MHLTTLTLSGFKSFARSARFEFPAQTSAIVGPNGSGKSNIAEAIRWVLGEQSLKTIRGKRGEDLIFNGSGAVARMGKAGVALVFANRDHAIPVDFDEVAIERKIFRDGANEYFLNGTRVRLKDIVELLAAIGLGETKHNIIAQGEVDAILLASAQERRSMLEEAMGLRLWQLKKREAVRKLEETARNISRVQGLRRELAPHLKFLKSQADKAEKAETTRLDLEAHVSAYLTRERADIQETEERLLFDVAPVKKELQTLEQEISTLGAREEAIPKKGVNGRETPREEFEKLEARRRELERELGRIEGRLESRTPRAPKTETVRIEAQVLERRLAPFAAELRRAAEASDLTELKRKILAIADAIEQGIRELARSPGQTEEPGRESTNLERERETTQRAIKDISRNLDHFRHELIASSQTQAMIQDEFRKRFNRLRELEDKRNDAMAIIQRASFESEKLGLRKNELEEMIRDENAAPPASPHVLRPELAELPGPELKKKIERFRARLEEITGLDQTVLAEYRTTRERSDFLEHELKDLEQAEQDLHDLSSELEGRIQRDFKAGFEKIKNEFHDYFKIIFGGGRGMLSYVPLKKDHANEHTEDGEDEDAEPEYGIEIDVNLPGKRIKGLEMLSGGERALVSIALLFAITAVNPPPFLVLDETDAALDEANSQKYAAILKELSKKTQLIIVTHNRETMKQAGVLYGVTMGEDGISKVLSLKLEEAADYGNR